MPCDQAAYDQLLARAKAEFVFTDPPYNVAIAVIIANGEMSEAESDRNTHQQFRAWPARASPQQCGIIAGSTPCVPTPPRSSPSYSMTL
jgi:site-specific DNA-adenine methylase